MGLRDKREKSNEARRGDMKNSFLYCFLRNMEGKDPIVLNKICGYNSLKCIRNKMSYHQFPNLLDIIKCDIVSKVMKVITLKAFLSFEFK